LDTTAASLIASSQLFTRWMVSLHHGKWMSCFGMKRKGLFCDFWHISDDFAIKNATDIFSKAEKA
jgi:hypothetical protein